MLSPRAKAYSAFALCVVIAILLVAIITLARQAHGHEAPSGWSYPRDCCNSNDCRVIACGTIKSNPDGSASWTGLLFYPEQVRMSGDAMCHVCVAYGVPRRVRFPHCIFLSPTM